MKFENLSIDRVVVHRVYKRLDDRQIKQPKYGADLMVMGIEDIETLKSRFIAAMGSAAKCIKMQITGSGPGSAVDVARRLVDSDDPSYLTNSRELADKLALAQTKLTIPGGAVVVMCGTVGHPPKRFVGIIKAEPHSGFALNEDTKITMQFLRDLVLTPEAKLYKIGTFVENPSDPDATDGWSSYVYDDGMTSKSRDLAAQYFYATFLGCNLPQNSARQTKAFFTLTREFISKLDLPATDKLDLNTGLFTYLKVEQTATVDTVTFSTRFLKDASTRDSYAAYMRQNQFPEVSISKDLSELESELRKRKVTIGSDVQLTAPAEKFSELIKIESIEGDKQSDGTKPTWTRITVRDSIRRES